MDAVEDHLTASQTSNVTILFGHYPSSVLGSGRMKQLMRSVLGSICPSYPQSPTPCFYMVNEI